MAGRQKSCRCGMGTEDRRDPHTCEASARKGIPTGGAGFWRRGRRGARADEFRERVLQATDRSVPAASASAYRRQAIRTTSAARRSPGVRFSTNAWSRSAMASGVAARNKREGCRGRRISGVAPMAVARTGVPDASASTVIRPKPSGAQQTRRPPGSTAEAPRPGCTPETAPDVGVSGMRPATPNGCEGSRSPTATGVGRGTAQDRHCLDQRVEPHARLEVPDGEEHGGLLGKPEFPPDHVPVRRRHEAVPSPRGRASRSRRIGIP